MTDTQKAAMLEIALRAVRQHLERDEYTEAGDVVQQALAMADQVGAPVAPAKPVAWMVEVPSAVEGWRSRNVVFDPPGFDGAAVVTPLYAPPVAPAVRLPMLTHVIEWLERGGDPLEAATELRVYQLQATPVAPAEPADEERAWTRFKEVYGKDVPRYSNPDWRKFLMGWQSALAATPGAQQAESRIVAADTTLYTDLD